MVAAGSLRLRQEGYDSPAIRAENPARTVSLDKTSAGTKNIFNKTGETLGLKKPTVKKPTMAYAKPPKLCPKAKDSPSWFAKFPA